MFEICKDVIMALFSLSEADFVPFLLLVAVIGILIGVIRK